MTNSIPPEINVLIFDMDGVLIDVSSSYREAIRRTVQIYFGLCFGFNNDEGTLVTAEDVAIFKSIGGFNNDWDLTAGLLLYLVSISGLPPSYRKRKSDGILNLAHSLRERAHPYRRLLARMIERKDTISFSKKVIAAGGGLKGVRRVLQETRNASWDGWIYHTGDIDADNLVTRIFQEIYLGNKFRSCYGLDSLFCTGDGYYLREKLIIPASVLSLLQKKFRLGIASGRPRFEAELALERFGIRNFFDAVVTLNECLDEERRHYEKTSRRIHLSKPHPFSLLKAIEEIGSDVHFCAYVGDSIDDIRATKAASRRIEIVSIGFLPSHSNKSREKRSLEEAGADHIVFNVGDLKDLLFDLISRTKKGKKHGRKVFQLRGT